MSLNLVDLRQRARIAARNAQDQTNYSNAQIDEALDRLFSRFIRKTRCVKLSVTVPFSASANEADFSGLIGFLASRIESLRVDVDTNYTQVCEDLTETSAGNVQDAVSQNSSTGTPKMIGFIDSITAKLYPVPKSDGTITCVYAPLQTPWTLGTQGAYSSSATYYPGDVVSSAGTLYSAISTNTNVSLATTSTWMNLGAGTLTPPQSISSAVPDGLLGELVGIGIAPMLQQVDLKQAQAVSPLWQRYLEFEQSCMGVGSISGKVSFSRRAYCYGNRW